jgi:hypothetical protein
MRRQHPDERRSGRPDRRVAVAPAPLPGGLERRVGPRRQLPRPLWRQWPSLLISAALGVVVAVSVQPAPATPAPPPQPAPPTIAIQLPFTRAEAAALRDEADRLTPAAVALDERAQARWWPLRPELEAAAADIRLPGDLRDEVVATLAALDRNGL